MKITADEQRKRARGEYHVDFELPSPPDNLRQQLIDWAERIAPASGASYTKFDESEKGWTFHFEFKDAERAAVFGKLIGKQFGAAVGFRIREWKN